VEPLADLGPDILERESRRFSVFFVSFSIATRAADWPPDVLPVGWEVCQRKLGLFFTCFFDASFLFCLSVCLLIERELTIPLFREHPAGRPTAASLLLLKNVRTVHPTREKKEHAKTKKNKTECKRKESKSKH